VIAGVSDLPILKTAHSSFRDFHRDPLTTLPDTDDRIFASHLTAKWTYAPGDIDWNVAHAQIRQLLLESFANHRSLGVQQTLFVMGSSVLNECPSVAEIELTMPNRHRILFDMKPFERTNPNEVFVTTDEPHGVISARLRRE
jgi:urate oxidase